ncbi:carboxypeptidase M32 [Roseicitreum antarcticum]|uniref:Metal-dependent carboxypeptidase n=1 Tax=Roseicitreum antarcticum TaxID=564137 RepID=A0A1H2XX57_9RHOB|nr:carboxypeptidase M32 [Roseicitreum antarcticum]SDW97410.1 carboxypeptidase Taq . Metallo peptidase. MEROPS family M32 [Roseicitreum antarcticum]
MTAYDELIAFTRETEALAQVQGRLGWDQETVMPRGAATQRGDEMAALEGVLHARRTDPRVADWLAAASDGGDPVRAAMLRHITRSHARNTKVPASLASELARVTSVAQGVWAGARAADDTAAFLPVLSQVVALRQQEAACLAGEGTLYDALMDDYEPEASASKTAAMFDRMRPRLVALRDAVLGAPTPPALTGSFAAEGQMALARLLATTFGYDFTRGRLDLAVHPFSSGSGADVRITTRVAADDPFNCLYSTIHEVGHACYEQNIDPDFALTPLGQGVSMGVHESQSRIYENQLGRSRAFSGWLFGQMQAQFGGLSVGDADALYAAINRVTPGYIRTESDEVQYNLHIMMRFDLERALVGGDLAVADLEGAWNDRFAADFGVVVDRPSNGVLQDVHWSVGLFGYFPTYTLGNVYAGCLHQTLRGDLPDLDAQLAQGDLQAATGWLRDRVQRPGGLHSPADTVAAACGFAPSEGPLLDYLEAKFRALYRL